MKLPHERLCAQAGRCHPADSSGGRPHTEATVDHVAAEASAESYQMQVDACGNSTPPMKRHAADAAAQGGPRISTPMAAGSKRHKAERQHDCHRVASLPAANSADSSGGAALVAPSLTIGRPLQSRSAATAGHLRPPMPLQGADAPGVHTPIQPQPPAAAALEQVAAGLQSPMLPRKRGRPRKHLLPPDQQQPQQGFAQLLPQGATAQAATQAAPVAVLPSTPPSFRLAPAAVSPHGLQSPLPPQQQQHSAVADLQSALAELDPAELDPSVVAAAHQRGPLVRGAAVDLPRLHAVLQQQAASHGAAGGCVRSRLSALWRQAQAVIVQHSLQLLVRQLEAMPPPPTDQVRGCCWHGAIFWAILCPSLSACRSPSRSVCRAG